ncbi:MAG: hypothetical protein DRJ52_05815 [Thermoprotei archaeon]|nr:MAG: hypothetical protein DRJ52_05815 [Thermoprotei archaeon]RLE98136.1 MAG: hypothetical protein DRJ63_08150 [Thermoprotei archaeon]
MLILEAFSYKLMKKIILALSVIILVAVLAVATYLLFLMPSIEKEVKIVSKESISFEVKEVSTNNVVLPKKWKLLSKIYSITPSKNPSSPIKIVFKLDSSQLKDVDVSTVQVFKWAEWADGHGFWLPVPSKVYTSNNTVVAEVTKFSTFGVFARYKNVDFSNIVEVLDTMLDKPPSHPDCVVGFFLLIDHVGVSQQTYPEIYSQVLKIVEKKALPYLKRVGGTTHTLSEATKEHLILVIGCEGDPKDPWDIRSVHYDFEHTKIIKKAHWQKITSVKEIYEILVVWYGDCGEDAIVEGTVYTKKGKPLEGAEVRAVDPFGKEYSTTTDSSGTYRLKLQSGLYKFYAVKDCCSGEKECLICAYGRLATEEEKPPKVNIEVSGENSIILEGDFTITASGKKAIVKDLIYSFKTTVHEKYTLVFTYHVVNETKDGFKYFEGKGYIVIHDYSVDALNIFEVNKKNLYIKTELKITGDFSETVNVTVAGRISMTNELVDLYVYPGGNTSALFCDPSGGTTYLHVLVITPVISSERKESKTSGVLMYPRDITVVVAWATPKIDVAEQTIPVTFTLNSDDFFMLNTKGILAGGTTTLRQTVPEASEIPEMTLGSENLKFSGTLKVKTCSCDG